MRPRVVFLAGLAVVAQGCLVQPADTLGDPNVDSESSALDTAAPVAPGVDPSNPGGGQPGPGGPITPGSKLGPTQTPGDDPTKPSPDPWAGFNLSSSPNSGVAVSPTTSKTGQ